MYRCNVLEKHILRPHLEAFVLILPNDGGIEVEQFGRELGCRRGRAVARLPSRPVHRRGRNCPALLRWRSSQWATAWTGAYWAAQVSRSPPDVGRDFVEGHEGVVAVLADQAGLAHVAGEQRQHRRAAAGRLGVSRRRRGEALEPDLAVVSELRREPVGCPASGCESRHALPSSWPSVCASQRASVRSSKSRKARPYSFQSRSSGDSGLSTIGPQCCATRKVCRGGRNSGRVVI